MNTIDTLAALLQAGGLLATLWALWRLAAGVRVVVSGRIDERRRAAQSLKWGVPMLIIGIALMLFGSRLAEWVGGLVWHSVTL